jgi:hypothetical protein
MSLLITSSFVRSEGHNLGTVTSLVRVVSARKYPSIVPQLRFLVWYRCDVPPSLLLKLSFLTPRSREAHPLLVSVSGAGNSDNGLLARHVRLADRSRRETEGKLLK